MKTSTARAFIFVLLLVPVFASATSPQFKSWYEEYCKIFQKLLRENCVEEHTFFRAGQRDPARFAKDQWSGATRTTQVVWPLASCMLDHCSEWMKVNMAAAAVLLGLTPAILAALGPSVEESSSLIIIARRPVLGFLLAAGAPSLYPFRTLEYKRVIEQLKSGDLSRRRSVSLAPTKEYRQYIYMCLEFAVAAGAIVNNAMNSYQLGVQTICVLAPHYWFLPLLWAFFGALAHLFGAWALWTRIKCERPYQNGFDWLKIQFTPLTEQEPLVIEPWPDSTFSVIVHWWVSIYIGAHVIFGSLAFSSLIFITVRDALSVVGRYMISLLACKIVLTYELSVLKHRYAVQARFQGVEDGDGQGIALQNVH